MLWTVPRFEVKRKLSEWNGHSLVKLFPSRDSAQGQADLKEIQECFERANDPKAFDTEYRDGKEPAVWKLSRFLHEEHSLQKYQKADSAPLLECLMSEVALFFALGGSCPD